MTSNKTNTKNAVADFLRTSFVSAGIGTIVSVVILFIISLFVIKINKHEIFHPALAITIQLIPALISGSLIGRHYGRSLLIIGVIEGLIISVLYLFISFCLYLGNVDFTAFLTSVPYITSSAVLGSIMSGSKKKKIK